MKESLPKTTERFTPDNLGSKEEYLLYLRHLYAYGIATDQISRNSFVLEVGTGEGYGTKLLSEHFEKIVGLDVDEQTIVRARKKYGSGNCVFTLYDGIRIPFEDNMFDAVISFQVIEHIQDEKNYVSEIYRILKTNGIFILTTPNRNLRLKPGQRPWNRFHVREYDPNELELVLKSKFSDVKIFGVFGNEEVQRIEIERVKRSLRITSFDPLDFRKLIPEPLKQKMLNILKRIRDKNTGIQSDRYFLDKYSVKDYFMSETHISESLDLLAILVK